jgi:quinol-cytochrome oxidoreductase complex cytochrome b subunit
MLIFWQLPAYHFKRSNQYDALNEKAEIKMEWQCNFYFLSTGQWLALALLCVVSILPATRMLRRAGYRQWWAVILVFPIINLIALRVLGYTRPHASGVSAGTSSTPSAS